MKLVLILLWALGVFAKTPDRVTIGFTPGDDPEWLKKSSFELAKSLQEKLETPISVYISKDYKSLVEAMKDKKVDFAFFSARTFIDAEKNSGAKVLLKKVWVSPFYYSSIVTLKKNKINSITDLKNKRFGFVDRQSASGYLYPRVMLMKKKLDPDKFFKEQKFAGNHDANVKALFSGEVDAIAVYADDPKGKESAWSKLGSSKASEVKILWMSEPIPNDPFCVRNDFYEKFPYFTYDMMAALIDYKDEPAEKNLLKKLFGVNAMETATSKQYDPVRELVQYEKK